MLWQPRRIAPGAFARVHGKSPSLKNGWGYHSLLVAQTPAATSVCLTAEKTMAGHEFNSAIHPLRVLLVEDSEDDAALLTLELRRGGFNPAMLRVDTPEALLGALQSDSWDIAFCDYAMPRFSGPSALALIQKTNPRLPVILISGTVSEDTAVLGIGNGAQDYLLKDNLQRLVPTVERILREQMTRKIHWLADAKLAEDERRYRALIENLPEVVFQTDADGRWVFLNPAWTEITGFSVSETLGHSLFDYLFSADRSLGRLEFFALLDGSKESCRYDARYRLRNGDFCWMETLARPVVDAQGNIEGLSGSLIDISHRKQPIERQGANSKSGEQLLTGSAAADNRGARK